MLVMKPSFAYMAAAIAVQATTSNMLVHFESPLAADTIVQLFATSPTHRAVLSETAVSIKTRNGAEILLFVPLSVRQQLSATMEPPPKLEHFPQFAAVPLSVWRWASQLDPSRLKIWMLNLLRPMISIRTHDVDLVKLAALFIQRDSPGAFPRCLSITPEGDLGYGVWFSGVTDPDAVVDMPVFGQLIPMLTMPCLHPYLRPRLSKLCACEDRDRLCEHPMMLINSNCHASYFNVRDRNRTDSPQVQIVAGHDYHQNLCHTRAQLVNIFETGTQLYNCMTVSICVSISQFSVSADVVVVVM
jgi:hypothetical protein